MYVCCTLYKDEMEQRFANTTTNNNYEKCNAASRTPTNRKSGDLICTKDILSPAHSNLIVRLTELNTSRSMRECMVT